MHRFFYILQEVYIYTVHRLYYTAHKEAVRCDDDDVYYTHGARGREFAAGLVRNEMRRTCVGSS